MILRNLPVDKTWTLFLDRDGVINRRIVGGYVKSWDELGFLPRVLDAIPVFSGLFGRIIIVSNQQGVGKGFMTHEDVDRIHSKMVSEIVLQGGRIDAAYFAPQLASERSIMRKPDVGMALKARRQFPEIRFKKSIMAGDSLSDMIFGKRLGMVTVFISGEAAIPLQHPSLVDVHCPDLWEMASQLAKIQTNNPSS
jgi:histidinol-phosphate phosphatase family protein